MLTVLYGDDYQLIVMDRGLAKTTLARRRQFSTGDTDRPKYSDLDPLENCKDELVNSVALV